MIFRSYCCNPKTTFTAGSLKFYTNPLAKNSILAMYPLGRSARAGGRNPGPAAAGLGRWAVPGVAVDRARAGCGLGRPAAGPVAAGGDADAVCPPRLAARRRRPRVAQGDSRGFGGGLGEE
jgi:hypothetical protein